MPFRRLLFPLLITALALLAPAAARAADPPPDWALTTLTAGPEGAQLDQVAVSYVRDDDGSAVPVNGVGVGSTAFSGGVRAFPAGTGPLTLAVPGSMEVELVQGQPQETPTSTLFTDPRLAPGETVGLLVFTGGVPMRDLDVTVGTVRSGSVADVRTRTGTGSAAVRQVSRASSGLGLNLGPVAAGSVTSAFDAPTGVAGAFVDFGCGTCSAQVTTPDGRTERHVAVDYFVGGTSGESLDDILPLPAGQTFTGPAGRYDLAWTGLAVNGVTRLITGLGDNTFVVYVPVGDDASLFAAKPGS